MSSVSILSNPAARRTAVTCKGEVQQGRRDTQLSDKLKTRNTFFLPSGSGPRGQRHEERRHTRIMWCALLASASLSGMPCCNSSDPEPGRMGRCRWRAQRACESSLQYLCPVACGVCKICDSHPLYTAYARLHAAPIPGTQSGRGKHARQQRRRQQRQQRMEQARTQRASRATLPTPRPSHPTDGAGQSSFSFDVKHISSCWSWEHSPRTNCYNSQGATDLGEARLPAGLGRRERTLRCLQICASHGECSVRLRARLHGKHHALLARLRGTRRERHHILFLHSSERPAH